MTDPNPSAPPPGSEPFPTETIVKSFGPTDARRGPGITRPPPPPGGRGNAPPPPSLSAAALFWAVVGAALALVAAGWVYVVQALVACR